MILFAHAHFSTRGRAPHAAQVGSATQPVTPRTAADLRPGLHRVAAFRIPAIAACADSARAAPDLSTIRVQHPAPCATWVCAARDERLGRGPRVAALTSSRQRRGSRLEAGACDPGLPPSRLVDGSPGALREFCAGGCRPFRPAVAAPARARSYAFGEGRAAKARTVTGWCRCWHRRALAVARHGGDARLK
jgi:hypothetical protein